MKAVVLVAFITMLPWLVVGPAPGRADARICMRQDPPTFEYLGSKSCQKCHFKEYSTWQKTAMGKAFETLKPGQAAESKKKCNLDPAKDYSRDPKCLPCHTTGYGKAGGYPAVVEGKAWTDKEKERAAMMEGVGCESCHGPGDKYSPYKKDNKDYKWAEIEKLGAVHPDDAVCRTCHNKDSPSYQEFKFEEKIGKDTHEVVPMKNDHACPHKHKGK